MKIPVREEKPKLQIEVKEASDEYERILTRALLLYAAQKSEDTASEELEPAEAEPKKQLDWRQVFAQLPVVLQDRASEAETEADGSTATKTYEIKLNLPSLDLKTHALAAFSSLNNQRRKLPKKVQLASVGGVIVLASFMAWVWTRPAPAASPDTGSFKAPTLTRGTPNYPTIIPTGKTINQLGGWVRISPPNRSPVYTYVDHVTGIQVDVSEQPLPKKFQTDTNSQIYQLAEEFGADSKLSASGTLAYVGTTQQGAQSVILTKDNLLILIKSALPVANTEWVNYINSLQ
jgi:hypothetical protein